MIENQYDTKPKIIRTDNGPEFLLPEFYASKGIIHQTSCVETPQQNGRVEKKHQHILNVGRALLFQSRLPKQYWPYAILHAAYVINCVPSPLLQNKSLFFLIHGKLPNLENLKVLRCLSQASTLQAHRSKLEPRGRKCVFLGYKTGVKGAILMDLNNKQIFISRNIIYHEKILPYKGTQSISQWNYFTPTHSDDLDEPSTQPEYQNTMFPQRQNLLLKLSKLLKSGNLEEKDRSHHISLIMCVVS